MSEAKRRTRGGSGQWKTAGAARQHRHGALLALAAFSSISAGCTLEPGALGAAEAGTVSSPGEDAALNPVSVEPALDAGGPLDATAPAGPKTTYAEHVRPILARACLSCHSQGQIAPFSLESYQQAKPLAPLIASATRERRMPPSVVDNSGACNTFRNLPWLSEQEIVTLEQWAEQGAPEGDPSLPAPPVRELPKLEGDVHTIKTPGYVPSTKLPDDYRCFVVESPFQENTFVTGFDTHPGDLRTAHHMVVFYPMDDTFGFLARLKDEQEEGPGYTCFGGPGVPATVLAAWAPGGGATRYPDNLGVAVAPNRPLIVQMHYNTVGNVQPGEDSTVIDLELQKDGISPGGFVNVLDLEMNLPPGQKETDEVVTLRLADKLQGKSQVQVYGVFPHMHELGKRLHLSGANADGHEQCLVDVPSWDFHWQRLYFFTAPITVSATEPLSLRCTFDTTSRTETTQWGEGTQDEMCVTGLFVRQ